MDRVAPRPDDLSEMLDAMRVRSVVYCRSELGAPWGLRVRASPQAKFHLVLNGSALFRLDDGDDAALEAGDLVLLPHGSGHVMRDQKVSRVRDLDRILEDHPLDESGAMHYGGRGHKTLLVCGEFDTVSFAELLPWLPQMLVTDTATSGLGRWLDPMTDLVRRPRGSKPGDAAVVAKVADVFLTDVLRQYLASSNGSLPMVIDGDPAITEVLALMHQRSSEPWTMASLAREVGTSRSSLAAKFRAAAGIAPMAYLTRLRLARAAGDLAASTRSLADVARAAAYDNDSSFSKAFARQHGQPPGQYRRTHRHRLGAAG
jgi:AraC-like DNA-binding protein/mannose-6-phosphate isomerase-like protein (cupin superfamily)